jgi:hypothetical protein
VLNDPRQPHFSDGKLTMGRWLGRWPLHVGTLILRERLTEEDRERARDPHECLPPSDVLREWWGYTGQGGGGYQNIAEVAKELGVQPHVIQQDPQRTMGVITEAIQSGRLMALRYRTAHHIASAKRSGRERLESVSSSNTSHHLLPQRERMLVLIGFEGPAIKDVNDGTKIIWRPTAADPQWREMVKNAVLDFLKNAQGEWHWDVSAPSVAVFKNDFEFEQAITAGHYDRVVVYSHGWPAGLLAFLNNDRTRVQAYTIAKALAKGNVKLALLLGCNSKQLAADAARIAEGAVRMGGIEPERNDHVEVRRRLDILNTIIWGFGGKP